MSKDKPFFSFLRLGTLLAFLVLVGVRCTEPSEGCIDALASNFELDTDIDCCIVQEECCCNYPTMRLNLLYIGTAEDSLGDPRSNIRLDQYYPLENLTDSIRIDSFSLFVSNIQVVSSLDMDTVRLFETLALSFTDANGEEQVASFQDNIVLVSMPNFSFDIGTYRSDIAFDEVSFDIGLAPALATIDPSSVDNGHPLGDEYTTLFDSSNNRFISGRIGFSVKRGIEEQIFTQDIDPFRNDFELFASPISIQKGENLDILMRINVLDILKGIIFDVSVDDVPSIINENLTSSISILE